MSNLSESTDALQLTGDIVRLERLDHRHTEDIAAASADGGALYQWSPVPRGAIEVANYIDTAKEAWKAGNTLPFAIIRKENNEIIGSTRFWNVEKWAWPPDHPRHNNTTPDVCEIGYTWLSQSAVRSGVNTEAKLLLLTYAFETWRVLRVSFHTDIRNMHSRTAIERIGGKFEGILRAQKMAADYTPRDSMRYSVIAEEWPDVKYRLTNLLNRKQ